MGVRHTGGQQRGGRPRRAPAAQARPARADPHRGRRRLRAAGRAVTIRLRLAVAFTALVGLILLLTGAVTYQLLRHSLLTEIQQDVVRRAQSFSRTGSPAPANLNPFAEPDVFLQVDRANGTVAARSANLGTRTLPAPPLILLDNAFKYTPPPGQVWLGAHVTGTEVVITVRDTGLGIPAEDLPHVFDRFCRGRNANT